MVYTLDENLVIRRQINRKGNFAFNHNWASVAESRIKMLIENPHSYLIRVHSDDLSFEFVRQPLINNWRWICLRRQNKLEQFLSFCLILGGQPTHIGRHENFAKNQIKVDLIWLQWFESYLRSYEKYKAEYAAIHSEETLTEVAYEDLCNNFAETMTTIFADYWDYFSETELRAEIEKWTIKLPYEETKWQYIKNADEVRQIVLQRSDLFGDAI
jgi:hypothetical protein